MWLCEEVFSDPQVSVFIPQPKAGNVSQRIKKRSKKSCILNMEPQMSGGNNRGQIKGKQGFITLSVLTATAYIIRPKKEIVCFL